MQINTIPLFDKEEIAQFKHTCSETNNKNKIDGNAALFCETLRMRCVYNASFIQTQNKQKNTIKWWNWIGWCVSYWWKSCNNRIFLELFEQQSLDICRSYCFICSFWRFLIYSMALSMNRCMNSRRLYTAYHLLDMESSHRVCHRVHHREDHRVDHRVGQIRDNLEVVAVHTIFVWTSKCRKFKGHMEF